MEFSTIAGLLQIPGAGLAAGTIIGLMFIRFAIQVFRKDSREHGIDTAYKGIIEDLRAEVGRLQKEVAQLRDLVNQLTQENARLSHGDD